MENKKINKLVVPLTLRTASILSAFTLMATSVGGCVQKNRDDNNNDEIISSTILPNDNDEDIKKDLDNKVDDNKNEEQKEVDNGITENNNNVNDNKNNSNSQNSNSTSEKNNTGNNNINNKSDNNNTAGNNNTGDNNNGNNNSQDPSQKDDNRVLHFIGEYVPLTPQNINDFDVFEAAAYKFTREAIENNSLGTAVHYKYKGKNYRSSTNGFEELSLVLALANRKYITDDTLHEVFKTNTEEELRRYPYFMRYFDMTSNNYLKWDWTTYVIEPGIGNYMNDMENEAYDQLTKGASNFDSKFNDFFYKKNGQYCYGDNDFLDVVLTQYAISIYKSDPSSDIYFDVFYANEDSISKLEEEAAKIYSRSKVLKK